MDFKEYLILELSLEEVKVRLADLGYPDLKIISGKTIAVLTNQNRMTIMRDLEVRLPGKIVSRPMSMSSLGYVDYDNFKILVKPASRQGRLSAGVDNEDILENGIKNIFEEHGSPLTVKFIGTNTNFVVKNVVDVVDVSTSVKGKRKADIALLKTKSGKQIGISVKKDNAETWESADSYFAAPAKKIIDKAVKKKQVSLTKKDSYYVLKPQVAVKATEDEVNSVMFGSDLIGANGAVVVKTFSPDDIKLEGDTIKVYATYVIKTLKDVPDEKRVYFLIRNDKSRNTRGLYPGLRVLAVTKRRIHKTVKRLDR